MFAVDQVEAETDGDERDQERQERHERQRRAAREQAQQENRVFRSRIFDLLYRSVNGDDRSDGDEPFEHQHAPAGEMVGQLLQGYDPEALPGRAFTLHGALPRSTMTIAGNNAYRSPRGSVPQR